MKDVTRTKAVCPFCGALNDAATAAFRSGQAPQSGDVSICAYCQEAGIFAKDEHGYTIVRKPTAQEWVQIVTNPQVIQAQIAIASLNLSKPNK